MISSAASAATAGATIVVVVVIIIDLVAVIYVFSGVIEATGAIIIRGGKGEEKEAAGVVGGRNRVGRK